MEENQKIKAVLLTGGKGSRIGSPKYGVYLNNLPLILYGYRKLKRVFPEVYFSIRHKEQLKEIVKIFKDFSMLDEIGAKNFIWDKYLQFEGPLAGILSAMERFSEREVLLVVAVDQPFISKKILNLLLFKIQENPGKVIVFYNKKLDKFEPFPGIYPCSFKKILKFFLEKSEKKSLYRFFIFLKRLNRIEFLPLNKKEISFLNINTQEDLKAAEKFLKLCFTKVSQKLE